MTMPHDQEFDLRYLREVVRQSSEEVSGGCPGLQVESEPVAPAVPAPEPRGSTRSASTPARPGHRGEAARPPDRSGAAGSAAT